MLQRHLIKGTCTLLTIVIRMHVHCFGMQDANYTSAYMLKLETMQLATMQPWKHITKPKISTRSILIQTPNTNSIARTMSCNIYYDHWYEHNSCMITGKEMNVNLSAIVSCPFSVVLIMLVVCTQYLHVRYFSCAGGKMQGISSKIIASQYGTSSSKAYSWRITQAEIRS